MHLIDPEYEDYRYELIKEGTGIETHLMEKLRVFRQMKEEDPSDESLKDAIETFVKFVKC